MGIEAPNMERAMSGTDLLLKALGMNMVILPTYEAYFKPILST